MPPTPSPALPVSASAPLLRGTGIGKRFGGAVALQGVDFDLQPGEIHGLIGSNGAGKSTLMKILAGAIPDHEGTIELEGTPVALRSPKAARDLGIAMVYQELSGIGALSVAENLFLGRQPLTRWNSIDWKTMNRQAAQWLRELDVDIDVRERLDRFPLVIRQIVEIARGLHSGARVLILDEPTSSLSPPETRRLFGLLAHLRERGLSMIFISHFLEDVLEICDQVTLLKDGRHVLTQPSRELTKHGLIEAMLGRGLESTEAAYESAVALPVRTNAKVVLTAQNLTRAGLFTGIDLEVAEGECLGLYGFVGAGHQELAHALAGTLAFDTGTLRLDHSPLRPGRVTQAVTRGVVLVAGDRSKTLVRGSEIYKNTTLAHLRRGVGSWLTRNREVAVVNPLLRQVQCRPPNPDLKAGLLSGGNQQKVVLAKWLLGPVRVLVLEEPTRGMDVGAKEEVMRLVADLKQRGAAVILASTEPELVLAHADRIVVLHRGRISAEFAGTTLDKTTLMKHA